LSHSQSPITFDVEAKGLESLSAIGKQQQWRTITNCFSFCYSVDAL